MSQSPPPVYSPPQRPPPPYESQNVQNERRETQQQIKVGPAPFVPLSAQSISADTLGQNMHPNQPTIVVVHTVKEAPTSASFETFCPKCQQPIKTRQNYVTGTFTWILVIIILFFFFPLAFVPFCLNSCKDVQHYCPKCSTLLAVKRKFF